MGLLDVVAPFLGAAFAVFLAACLLWPSHDEVEPEAPVESQPEADVPWWRPPA